MTTQKKVSRKSYIHIILLVILLSLVGCYSSKEQLREDDFRIVKYGMEKQEVEMRLGKPDKVIRDSEEVIEAQQCDADTSTDRWDIEFPNLYENFYGSEKVMEDSFKLLEKGTGIDCYVYYYQRDNNSKKQRIWHLYFYDGKIIGMFFP
ncbi:hypothetical protein [Enterococcus sp. AZ196]|uniref:hypothetical protein n=1 Tax=Enterococcus sp. AZ196 TaxID=2774659 RepID=UPI003D2762D0